jgi:hypothetical protein
MAKKVKESIKEVSIDAQERLAEIKETILKPGARWYCDHFREKYRAHRDEDALWKWHQRRE